jgi:glycerol-1-phosphate dehydrogenase [NAD(P)+]
MELQQLLGSSFECQCGKRHQVPIHAFAYSSHAIETLPSVLERYVTGRIAAIIADERTWQVCGQRVHKTMQQAGWNVRQIIVPDTSGSSPACDDVTVEKLKATIGDLSPKPCILVAVGSGVINDLTKWSGFALDIPYAAVATAASMNGYSAANVAPTVKGVKVLVRGTAPLAVFAEPQVIEQAPFEMTASGFGDALAKCMSGADWLMNNYLFGEHYCPLCSGIVDSLEGFYLKRPEDIKERKPAAIEGLFKGLFWSGVAMTLTGSSAPASGGEHLLSHTLDMVSTCNHLPHDLHGRQVGIGTIFSAALYEHLMAMEEIRPASLPAGIDADFWRLPIQKMAVMEQWQAKRGELDKMGKTLSNRERWQELKSRLSPILRPPSEVKDLLTRAGAASTAADIGCSRQRLSEALLHMHEIRKRCTVVDLAWVAGLMPSVTDEIIDRWLVK